MQYNVAQLLKDPVGATREYELDAAPGLLADVPAVARYVGRAKFTRINEGILAEVRIRTRVRLNCSRCLTETEEPLALKFTEEFRQTVDLASGAQIAAREGEDAFLLDQFHTLDLTEAIRQYALMAIPLTSLCREDCAGLCPVCGQDRNQVHCEHQTQPVDPRLGILSTLLEDEERS